MQTDSKDRIKMYWRFKYKYKIVFKMTAAKIFKMKTIDGSSVRWNRNTELKPGIKMNNEIGMDVIYKQNTGTVYT